VAGVFGVGGGGGGGGDGGKNILELGAGTGFLSILCTAALVGVGLGVCW